MLSVLLLKIQVVFLIERPLSLENHNLLELYHYANPLQCQLFFLSACCQGTVGIRRRIGIRSGRVSFRPEAEGAAP
jgi:hypothetical protein